MNINLFGVGQFGKSANVTAQERLNCYIEPQVGDDRAKVAIYGTPGLVLFTSFGETPIRGLYTKGDFLYVVHRGTLYEINNAAVATAKGTIGTTTGRVYLSDNGIQLMLTDGVAGYIYFFNTIAPVAISTITKVTKTATVTTTVPHNLVTGRLVIISGATSSEYNGSFVITVTGTNTFTYTMLSAPAANATVVGAYTVPNFTQITDADYPNAATLTWMDSYFIVNQPLTQKFYISGQYDGLNWNSLDFSSAEANPDNILAVMADNSNLYLFGQISTEFWNNTGALDFPYARISGGATEWGLAAVNSLVKYDNSLAFLSRNKMGQVFIAKMVGYQPQRISTPELEYIINNYSAVEDATAFSYLFGGHPMYQINFPTGGESWLYDGLSQCWSKLQSYGLTRHRAEMGVSYLNKIMVTDYANGNLYRLDQNSYTDNGDPIALELITRHIDNNNLRTIIDKVQLEMETGVGAVTGQGSDPQIMLSISKDNGHTYGNEMWVSFGAIGKYKVRAVWRRLGLARDWVFKFRITDPVKRVIYGANVDIRSER